MADSVGKLAVSAATYAIDKLYQYRIPENLQTSVTAGVRVLVPFGPGDKVCEAIVVQTQAQASISQLKSILQVLDTEPVLNGELLHLAAYMREHLYCTYFDCVKTILPSCLWFRHTLNYQLISSSFSLASLSPDEKTLLQFFSQSESETLKNLKTIFPSFPLEKTLHSLCKKNFLICEDQIQKKANDKTVRQYRLAVSYEEAIEQVIHHKKVSVRTDVVRCFCGQDLMDEKELMYMTGVSKTTLHAMVKAGLLAVEKGEVYRLPDYSKIPMAAPLFLSKAQSKAFDSLYELLRRKTPQAALLYGVTGSGKTQIYIKLIAETLKMGKSSLVLVPEIGLTPQLIGKFVSYFGEKVTVMHSALSAGERYDSWKKAKTGKKIIIGTRSAVFAPVPDLGLLIVDEEQDPAYKSEISPRYHAIDLAKYRVGRNHALLVLGSATPSVETYYDTQIGKYPVFSLKERYLGSQLPQVKIADMRGLICQGYDGSIGPILREELSRNLLDGKQSILFLNRRGNSRVVSCPICGWTPVCENCSISMTYHSVNGRLLCHYCGASKKMPSVCPECGGKYLQTEIPGTQKVEEELHTLFPDARILRMDADTVMTKNAHEKLFRIFSSGKADILLGTQMVTKGLDFENVTLVGILEADQSLYAQDFRAKERTFSLLTQVIGRAGRRYSPGRAVIQTYSPEDPIILLAAKQDYEKFYGQEILRRKALQCPPIAQILELTAIGENELQVVQSIENLKERIESLMLGQFKDFRYPVLGPAPSSVVRVNQRYRYHLIIRCPDTKRRRDLISGLLKEFAKNKKNKGVILFADQNPQDL